MKELSLKVSLSIESNKYHIIKIYEGTESIRETKAYLRKYHIIKIYEGTESYFSLLCL